MTWSFRLVIETCFHNLAPTVTGLGAKLSFLSRSSSVKSIRQVSTQRQFFYSCLFLWKTFHSCSLCLKAEPFVIQIFCGLSSVKHSVFIDRLSCDFLLSAGRERLQKKSERQSEEVPQFRGPKEHGLRNAFRLRGVTPNSVFRDITVMYFSLWKGVRRALHSSGFSPRSILLRCVLRLAFLRSV